LVNEGKEPAALEKPMMVALSNYMVPKNKKKASLDIASTLK